MKYTYLSAHNKWCKTFRIFEF